MSFLIALEVTQHWDSWRNSFHNGIVSRLHVFQDTALHASTRFDVPAWVAVRRLRIHFFCRGYILHKSPIQLNRRNDCTAIKFVRNQK
jgi:hypothetical protein